MSEERLLELKELIVDIEYKKDWGFVGKDEALCFIDTILKEQRINLKKKGTESEQED